MMLLASENAQPQPDTYYSKLQHTAALFPLYFSLTDNYQQLRALREFSASARCQWKPDEPIMVAKPALELVTGP